MSKTELYITRHGQSYGNIPAKSGERAKDVLLREDPPLTEPGIRQAQLLGERLSQVQFDSIISSPLRRAVATAYETAVRQPGGACEIELLPDMIEVGTQPGFTGVGFEMLKKDFPCVVKYDTEKYGIGSYVPEEENELQPFERAQKVAQHILTRFPFDSDKKVLLVA
ncbi:MAG: histidine phosphatase family protein, partial [Clostridiales bacterium]|nr:histidine phosphatase family protein [Clostridiales bacterium]